VLRLDLRMRKSRQRPRPETKYQNRQATTIVYKNGSKEAGMMQGKVPLKLFEKEKKFYRYVVNLEGNSSKNK